MEQKFNHQHMLPTNKPRSLFLFHSPALLWYVRGLVVYCTSLYIGARLNPRDMYGGSWTDRYLQAISGMSFLVCLIAPWYARRSWLVRTVFFLLGTVVASSAFWLWYISTG